MRSIASAASENLLILRGTLLQAKETLWCVFLRRFYENGVFRPLEDPGLNEHTRVVLEIKEKTEDQQAERPRRRVFGSAKGLIKYISDDFDEPLEDFAEYM